jgi:vesicle-fusing ATPase
LVLATTNQRHVLQEMELIDSFNASIYVPNITSITAVDYVLKNLGTFSEIERHDAIDRMVRGLNPATALSVGIKRLIYMSEMASQDADKVDKFVQIMQSEGFSSK